RDFQTGLPARGRAARGVWLGAGGHIDSGLRVDNAHRMRTDFPEAAERHLLRSPPAATVSHRGTLRHGSAAVARSAAEDAAEHRRAGQAALPGTRPVEDRAPLSRKLAARTS